MLMMIAFRPRMFGCGRVLGGAGGGRVGGYAGKGLATDVDDAGLLWEIEHVGRGLAADAHDACLFRPRMVGRGRVLGG